jgi:hypothetical protein
MPGVPTLLGHRRIRHQCLSVVHDAALKLFFAAIDPRKHQRRRQQLEGAAQCEALLAPMVDPPAAVDIEDRHPEAAAVGPFERHQLRHRTFRIDLRGDGIAQTAKPRRGPQASQQQRATRAIRIHRITLTGPGSGLRPRS